MQKIAGSGAGTVVISVLETRLLNLCSYIFKKFREELRKNREKLMAKAKKKSKKKEKELVSVIGRPPASLVIKSS